jgi:hypothetical protein
VQEVAAFEYETACVAPLVYAAKTDFPAGILTPVIVTAIMGDLSEDVLVE